ncbi:unnamed protein product [Calypogeia fissa]
MASRSTGSAVARRFMAAAKQARSGVRGLQECQESRRVIGTSSWTFPQQSEYIEPGLLASTAPRTYQHPSSEWAFPWALQGFQKPRQTVLLSFAEKRRESIPDDEEEEEEEKRDNLADGLTMMNVAESRKILQKVNAVALKKRLKSDPRDSFSYRELLDFIKESGVVANDEEAMRFARILDEAGVVLIFRENVFIHPERVAKLVAHALPFAVVPPSDPRRAELMTLEQEKAEIDVIAHKQVRRYLWTGLLALTCQAALFFRLTFWELSWDVMEPIAFFVGSAGLIIGYTYFLFTARDPTYKDFMERLFRSRQLKLFKKKKFDYLRYQLLKRQCQCLDPDENDW